MSNVKYRFSEDGLVAYGELASGQIFVIDADMVEKIRTVKFYLGSKGNGSQYYVIDCKGRTLHACKGYRSEAGAKRQVHGWEGSVWI